LREALFIKKNKDRWNKISYLPSDQTDEIAEEFIQLTDDLGYAKTFYPHSNITKYLNTEASKRYLAIYKNRKEQQNKLLTFFKYDVPMAVAKHQLILAICFFIFILFFVIGFYSATKDENFVSEIMGADYVRMTEENIAKGNPFDVYKTENQLMMFLGIMVNNIGVSFRYYLEGLLFPILTIPELCRDGLMVGSFDYMFYDKGLGNDFFLTIMIHGTLELSAISIAAASGVVLGKSWIFPGTRSRKEAFILGAKDSIKIIIGLIPVFVIAAFFESFVTANYATRPTWVSILILASSLAFVVGYFGIYPFRLKRNLKKAETQLA